MNGKERMRRVMRGEKPDRVPVMCQLATGHIYLNAGLPPDEFWYTAHGMAEGYIRMAERYGFDGILVNKPAPDPSLREHIVRIEPDPDGQIVVWRDGRRSLCPPDENPRSLTAAAPPQLKTIAELDVAAIAVPATAEDLPPYYFALLEEVLARKGRELSIHGEVGTAFESFLLELGSFECGLMALADDPERCHMALERINRGVIVWALAQCARGVDAMKLSSPIAGAGFISRAMYEEFVLPYESAVIESVHRHYGLPCYIHTCGAIGDRLDLMARSGTDGLECLDPPPLGTVDLAQAVAAIGDNLFIKGNLDSVNELLPHSAAEVREIARRRIAIGRRARGYILSSACSIAPRVPPENILALREAAEQ